MVCHANHACTFRFCVWLARFCLTCRASAGGHSMCLCINIHSLTCARGCCMHVSIIMWVRIHATPFQFVDRFTHCLHTSHTHTHTHTHAHTQARGHAQGHEPRAEGAVKSSQKALALTRQVPDEDVRGRRLVILSHSGHSLSLSRALPPSLSRTPPPPLSLCRGCFCWLFPSLCCQAIHS